MLLIILEASALRMNSAAYAKSIGRKGREGMREEKEIREELKRLKDEHLRMMREPGSYATSKLVAMIGTLEWVLGDKKNLPDFM